MNILGSSPVFVDRSGMLVILFLAGLASALGFALSDEPGRLIVLIGWLYLAASALPLIAARVFFIFSPPVFVFLTVAIGCYARSFFLLNGDARMVSVLTGGQSLEHLVPLTGIGLAGLFFLSLGYISVVSRRRDRALGVVRQRYLGPQ